jgi:hypothetical protein
MALATGAAPTPWRHLNAPSRGASGPTLLNTESSEVRLRAAWLRMRWL